MNFDPYCGKAVKRVTTDIGRWCLIFCVGVLPGCADSTGSEPTMNECLRVSEVGWSRFLKNWSDRVLTQLQAASVPLSGLPKPRSSLGVMVLPGASEEELSEAEGRLALRFPESVRSFFLLTNGLREVGLGRRDEELYVFVDLTVLPLSELRRYPADVARAWIQGMEQMGGSSWVPDDQYFIYGERQKYLDIRPEYMESSILITPSDRDHSELLLNPNVVFSDGEWEVWDFSAEELVGAIRYRSFAEAMEAQCAFQLEESRAVYEHHLKVTAGERP